MLVQHKLDEIYFRNHYKNYRTSARRLIDSDRKDLTVVVRLDIQNYFESIDIGILIDELCRRAELSDARGKQSQLGARDQIIKTMLFLMGGGKGIPQFDIDVPSGFLGHVYLTVGDLILDDIIRARSNQIESHKILRYVDDYFVAITFRSELGQSEQNAACYEIFSQFSDRLYLKLGLRLNSKATLHHLGCAGEGNVLLKEFKKVSAGHEIPDDDDMNPPQAKLERVLGQVRRLRDSALDMSFRIVDGVGTEVLSDVYDPSVENIARTSVNQSRIRDSFAGMDYWRVAIAARPLTVLIRWCADIDQGYRAYLGTVDMGTIRAASQIREYLCQIAFSDEALRRRLSENDVMKPIVGFVQSSMCDDRLPGYYEVPRQHVLKLLRYPRVIEQIRYRVLAELAGDYTLALNHLLNEVHALCYCMDDSGAAAQLDQNKYKREEVGAFLETMRVPHDLCIGILKLFEQRNRSPVSHPSSDTLNVSTSDYARYRRDVGQCIDVLLVRH